MSVSEQLREAGRAPEEAARSYTHDEIYHRIKQLGPWLHNLDLRGMPTAPDHFLGDYPAIKWRKFCSLIPEDLSGKTVLDVGCNGGFYSIEMKRRGAQRVVAVDSSEQHLAQARFAAEVSQTEIEFHRMSAYDLEALQERFDYVLFMGLLPHLRYPLYALDKIAQVVRERLIFQTILRGSEKNMAWPDNLSFWNYDPFKHPDFPCLYFIEHQYGGDPTIWWIPNRPAAEALLRSAGFVIVEHPDAEIWICRPYRGSGPASLPHTKGC
jgi:tRNA (mo5U34)-methyltransferase